MENLTDTLQTKINEARNLLSKESREAIDNVNWKLTVLGMNKKYTQEQLENLETETELLLCGLLTPENYSKELENRMHITKDEVDLLIGEMDRLIFKKIQDNLEKILVLNNSNNKSTKTNQPVILDSAFSSLPRKVQEAVARSNWKEKLYKIAEKYKLSIEQMGILEEITIKVMTNEIPSYEYENKIISRMSLPKEDISNLVNDVNNDVLKAIRELLKENWDVDEQTETEEVPLPPYAKAEIKTEIPKVVEAPKSFKSVEEITPLPPQNIIEEKLKSATASTNTVSNYSVPPVVENKGDEVPQSHDPYREPIK
jgi:hypothetical protein